MAGLLDGKSALITGGGGGIGRATALAFAREGARVAVADVAVEAAHETVAQVNRAGGQAISLSGDVTRDGDVRAMIEERRRRLRPARLRVQQRRHCRLAGRSGRKEDRGMVRGSLRPHDRGEPQGRVAVHAARAAADASPGRRDNRQYRLDRRAGRAADLVRLCRRQARCARPDQDRRDRIRRRRTSG